MLTWMLDAPIPNIVRPPFAVVGGTFLLKDFFARVSNCSEPAEILICSPFVDQEISDVGSTLANIPHGRISLNILTTDNKNAAKAYVLLGRFPWASIFVGQMETLHAKIYLFSSARPEHLCLVGSHNLTKSGFARNFEAGILMGSTGGDAISECILQLRNTLQSELRRSNPFRPDAHGIV
jgi:phosphatidylserine/phosphatidylglycerophosphate/cardiolipin synthase-like enzyme